MELVRQFFNPKPPDRLLKISDRTYVFDCCLTADVLNEGEYTSYLGGIVAQLQDYFPDASFMVFDFREGTRRSQIYDILTQNDMTVMEYPRDYEGCPLLPLKIINHFLRTCDSWLTLGQENVLLMHCDIGGWPVLAFMLAGLLLYKKLHNGEWETLEMIYKQAPREILHLLSPMNPQPSQLRYLHYISRRDTTSSDWPPPDSPLSLDCIILRVLPLFDGGRGCRPLVRLYGQDPSSTTYNWSPKLLFSTLKTKKQSRLYQQEECALVKIDIHQLVQGDIVLECFHLNNDFEREEMMFRVMFHTAFIRSNILMLASDEVDVLWDAKDLFPRDFRVEVLFTNVDSVPPMESEDGSETAASPEEFFVVEEIFTNAIDEPDEKGYFDDHSIQESVQPPSPPPPPPPPTPLPSQNAVLISEAPPPLPPPPHLPSRYSQAAVNGSILPLQPPPPPPKLPSTYPPSVQESSQDGENEEVAWKDEMDKQKAEKALTSTSKKQSTSNAKSAADADGAKSKLKPQVPHGPN